MMPKLFGRKMGCFGIVLEKFLAKLARELQEESVSFL